MKLGSLFDGIGGFPLAATMHSIEPVWASEIEPFPIEVTKARFPGMKHLGDITQINGAEIEPVDIISAGSPCQDLSVAGKREGLSGARSGLFMEFIRIVREMRNATTNQYPRFIIWENVPGAFSSNAGQDFRAVLEEITEAEIPMPHTGRWATAGMVRGGKCEVAWRVLDAQYWGVPQRRRRIFLVADFAGQRAGEILFECEGVSRDITKSRKAREEVAAGIGAGVENAITFRDVAGILRANAGAPKHEADWEQLICHSIGFNGDQSEKTRSMGEAEEQCPTLRAGGSTHVAISYGIQGSMIGRADKNGPQGDGINEDVSFTLNTTDRHAVAYGVVSKGNGEAWVTPERHMALNTGGGQAGQGYPAVLTQEPKAYGICSDASNSMKSNNPHSGIYEADTTRTLDQNGGNPACNQGGMAVVERVLFEPRSQDGVPRIHESEIVPTLNTAQGGQRQPCIASNYTVRRLTPLECERLQGFPDGWTDIPGASDTGRYKALGNSLAIPCVSWIIGRIKSIFKMQCERWEKEDNDV